MPVCLTIPAQCPLTTMAARSGSAPGRCRVVDFLEASRKSIIQLLGSEQGKTPTAADLSNGLQTLRMTVDTAWRLVERDRLLAEKEKTLAYVEQVEAGTEKIKAQKL